MPKRIDLTGKQFGEWTVLKYIKYPYYLCQCSCGVIKKVASLNLIPGYTTQCRKCGSKQAALSRSPKYSVSTKTRLYGIWTWGFKELLDFERFIFWSLNNGYKEGMYLWKFNVDAEYSLGNCYWAHNRQMENKGSHFTTMNGETKSITRWGKQFGITKQAMAQRVEKRWTDGEMFAGERLNNKKHSKYKDKYGMTQKEMSVELGISLIRCVELEAEQTP